MKIASGAIDALLSNGDESREVAGVRVVAREASGLDSAGMRQLSDTLLARIKSGVVVLGRSSDGKVSLIVRTSADLTGRVPAGQVIKELAPMVGGRGGGKADMAEGGGSQPEKLGDALEASYAIVERLLSYQLVNASIAVSSSRGKTGAVKSREAVSKHNVHPIHTWCLVKSARTSS